MALQVSNADFIHVATFKCLSVAKNADVEQPECQYFGWLVVFCFVFCKGWSI